MRAKCGTALSTEPQVANVSTGVCIPGALANVEAAPAQFPDSNAIIRSNEWVCEPRSDRRLTGPIPKVVIETPFRRLLQTALRLKAEYEPFVLEDEVTKMHLGVQVDAFFG